LGKKIKDWGNSGALKGNLGKGKKNANRGKSREKNLQGPEGWGEDWEKKPNKGKTGCGKKPQKRENVFRRTNWGQDPQNPEGDFREKKHGMIGKGQKKTLDRGF